MKKLILATLIGASSLLGIEIPKPTIFDKRVVYTDFNKDDVFQIYGKNGYTTVVQFSPDEVSETVNKKSIIEPTPDEWKTNLIVLTNKREYIFNLDLNIEQNSFFKFTFSYPADQKAKEDMQLALMKKEVEKQEVQTELNRTAIPRNWYYYMNINPESENISPSFAYADGQFRYLGFDSTKDIRSVFLYENEKESILNNHIKKEGNYDVLVIQKTAKQIVLRSGKRIVGIDRKSV